MIRILLICLCLSACVTPFVPPPTLPDPPVVEPEPAPEPAPAPAPEPEPEPEPEPIPRPAGFVRLEGNAFADDDGPYNAIGASLMWGMWAAKHDPDKLTATLDYLAPFVDYVRVLSMVGSLPYWEGRVIDPRWPDYGAVLHTLLDACAARGLRVQVVLFADAQVMMPDHADRRAWVRQMAIWLETQRAAVQFVEIANESNFNDVDDDDLRELTILWDSISDIPVAPSSPDGGNAEESINRLFDGRLVGADLLTPHFDRRTDTVETVYRPHRQPWEVQFYNHPLPFVNNEPIGPGSSGETEADPARLAIGLANTFIAGGAGYVIHGSAGVRGLEDFWTVVTPDILTALKATADLLPAGIQNAERCNHHWACHPYDTDDQIWPDTNGSGVVRAFAVNLGAHSYVAVMGLRESYTVTAKWDMGIEVFDVGTGARIQTLDLNAGEEWTFDETTRDFLHRLTRR